MLPLPWWILGVGPEEDSDNETDTLDDDSEHCEEVGESAPSTPYSMFRTPSSMPFTETRDELPKVVNLSTFMSIAKRRSSSKFEIPTSPKVRKTEKRNSLVRNETEIMNKTMDEQGFGDFNQTIGMPFVTERILLGSPMPLNDTLNETFNLDFVDGPNEERSSEESPVRDQHLRMFLDSFNETTVLFNTTMTGDVNLNEKNEAVGDWVFKNSKFLHEEPTDAEVTLEPVEDNAFKEPGQPKKKRGRKPKVSLVETEISMSAPRTPRPRAVGAKAQENEHEKVEPQQEKKGTKQEPKQEFELENDGKDKDDAEKEPSTSTPSRAPSLTRRHTPSRKVKTYKSLRE